MTYVVYPPHEGGGICCYMRHGFLRRPLGVEVPIVFVRHRFVNLVRVNDQNVVAGEVFDELVGILVEFGHFPVQLRTWTDDASVGFFPKSSASIFVCVKLRLAVLRCGPSYKCRWRP